MKGYLRVVLRDPDNLQRNTENEENRHKMNMWMEMSCDVWKCSGGYIMWYGMFFSSTTTTPKCKNGMLMLMPEVFAMWGMK